MVDYTRISSILSDEEIYNIFQKFLKELNYKGEILNILSSCLTQSVILTNLSSALVTRESNLMTATQLNSLLAISFANFTRIPRGNCQRLIVKNLNCILSQSVKSFDLLTSIGAYKIYFLDDKSFESNESGVGLRLIVAKDKISYEETPDYDNRLISDTYSLDVPGEFWSDDFLLYKDDRQIYDSDEVPVDLHNTEKYYGYMYTKEAKKLGGAIPYLVMTTSPNYGITIFNYNKFSEVNKYTFKGLVLLDETVDDMLPDQIKELPGFTFNKNEKVVESIPSVFKESNHSRIRLLNLANFRDRNLISSNYGLEEIIKLKLSDTFLGFKVNYLDGKIYITYILQKGKSWDLSKEKKFIDDINFNYKITDELIFEKAQVVYVRLFLKVIYNNILNQLEVYNILSSFEEMVGGTYYVDSVKTAISKLEAVSRVELMTVEDNPYAVFREEENSLNNDKVLPLERKEEIPILDGNGNPIFNENGKPKTQTKIVMYQLQFDSGNKTENSNSPTNKIILFVSESKGD